MKAKIMRKNKDTCSKSGLVVNNFLDNLQLTRRRPFDQLITGLCTETKNGLINKQKKLDYLCTIQKNFHNLFLF